MGDLWGDPTPINTTTSTTALPTTTSWAPVNPPLNKCNYYIVNQSSVEFLDFGNPYGGIPQNLLINAVCWLVLVLSFAILRRAAGNYGRLALIRHTTLILHCRPADTDRIMLDVGLFAAKLLLGPPAHLSYEKQLNVCIFTLH